MEVDAIVRAVLDCLQDLPDGTPTTRELAEQNKVNLVFLRLFKAFGQDLSILILCGSADVLFIDALYFITFGGREFG